MVDFPEGYLPHDGGLCPVPPYSKPGVIIRGFDRYHICQHPGQLDQACNYQWEHDSHYRAEDIVAYKPQDSWRTMSSAPTDKLILLYGHLKPHPDDEYLYGRLDQMTRVVGYWDTIDDAWAVHGGTYLGPWFEPVLWSALEALPCYPV